MSQPFEEPRILLFHQEAAALPAAPGIGAVASPLAFLHLAGETPWQEFVVSFFGLAPCRRPEVLELCTCLRRGSRTRAIPLTVLMPQRHRGLLSELAAAGVERVDYLPPEALAAHAPEPGPLLLHAPLIADELASICPQVHYDYLDSGQELVCCAARGNTLILGGRRLEGTCFSPDFRRCESYLRPRAAAGGEGRRS